MHRSGDLNETCSSCFTTVMGHSMLRGTVERSVCLFPGLWVIIIFCLFEILFSFFCFHSFVAVDFCNVIIIYADVIYFDFCYFNFISRTVSTLCIIMLPSEFCCCWYNPFVCVFTVIKLYKPI